MLSQQTKDYIVKHQLESTITSIVNEVLVKQSPDPYSHFATAFAQKATDELYITDMTPIMVLSNDGMPQIRIDFTVKYQERESRISSPVTTNTPSESNIYVYDEEPQLFQGKGLKKARDLIIALKPLVIGIVNDELDHRLEEYLQKNPTHYNAVIPISFSIPFLRETVLRQPRPKLCPQLFINVLQGSKLVASKCKLYRVYLIVQEPIESAMALINAVVGSVRKTITSSKLGEAALKLYTDGTFICPADTINDNLKIVEDAAAPFKERCAIGISWQADLFYNGKTYELDNPKQLLDGDQLIEYYYKLCSDRPLVQYLEDPLFSGDTKGWLKLQNRFRDTKVKLGSRRLYATLEQLKHHFEGESPDQIRLPVIFVRPYELGTHSAFTEYARIAGEGNLLVSGQLSDTLDCQIVTCTQHAMLNLGAPNKYEKVLKFNSIMDATI